MPLTLSGTNGVSGVDGSNTTPSVRGGTSASNGVFYGTNTVSVATNGVERTRVDSSGNLNFITADTGIIFNKTGALTNSTLNDYEEGSWTPTISGSTTTGTGTYTTQTGRYVKIGALVYCQAYIAWTAHTGTGNFWLTGLPFTLFATSNNHPSGVIGYITNVALTASNIATIYGSPNTTRLNLQQTPTGGGASSVVPIDTAGEIIYSISYYAA